MVKKPFESRIQDLVYNIDVGLGLRLVQIGLGTLVLLFLMMWYTASQFHGLKDRDAMDAAQLGHNLALQKRYVTQYVRPASMRFMREHSPAHDAAVESHPELIRPPVYPAMLAAGFTAFKGAFGAERRGGIFTPEQWIVIPMNHLFVILTGVLVFLTGKRLFSLKVALLGMVIFFLSRTVWNDSIEGAGLPVVYFLCAAAFYSAMIAAEAIRAELPWTRWILPFGLSAACCAVAVLTRYAAVLLVPGILLYLAFAFRRRAWLGLTVFLVIVAVGVSPWLARNKKVCGAFLGMAPYSALADSRLSEADDWERGLTFNATAGTVARTMMVKWKETLASYQREGLHQAGDGLLLLAFFLASCFFRFVRREVHLLRWALALSMLLILVTGGIFGDGVFRLLNVFWPFGILYGLAFFFLLLDRLQFQMRLINYAITGLVMLLSAMPLVFALMPPHPGVPYPPYFPPFIQHVTGLLEPTEVLCTDMPWATAWYGNRISIYLPLSIDEFYQINDFQLRKPIKGLYFTTLTRDKPYARVLRTGPYKTWFPILEGRIPSDFPLTQGFPLNNLDQLFLTDRARWTEKK